MIYGCLTDLKNLMRTLVFEANVAKLNSLHYSFKTYILLKHNLIYQEDHESFPGFSDSKGKDLWEPVLPFLCLLTFTLCMLKLYICKPLHLPTTQGAILK